MLKALIAALLLSLSLLETVSATPPPKVDEMRDQMVRIVAFKLIDGKRRLATGSGFVVRVLDYEECIVEVVTAQHVMEDSGTAFIGNGVATKWIPHYEDDAALVRAKHFPCKQWGELKFQDYDNKSDIFGLGYPGWTNFLSHTRSFSLIPRKYEANDNDFPLWKNAWVLDGFLALAGMSGGAVMDTAGHVFGILVGSGFGMMPAGIYIPITDYWLRDFWAYAGPNRHWQWLSEEIIEKPLTEDEDGCKAKLP